LLSGLKNGKIIRGMVMKRYYIYIVLCFLLASCAHIISQEYHQRAVRDVSFRNMLDNPDAYIDRTFILGGIIAEAKNTREGTEIEVVQTPVDRYGYIIDNDASEGRFMVFTKKQLDPLIYKKGRLITLAGRLKGTKAGLLGNVEFTYPLIEADEIYLWREDRYYRPYFYNYYYDPFLYSYPYSYGYGYYPFWPGYYYRYPWWY
jgi:outer membrane lipoprotein